MSGGCFNYVQYQVQDAIDIIRDTVKNNEEQFSEDTLADLECAITLIGVANVYLQRADWLLSGDDSEETFKERLAKDLVEVLRGNTST